MYVLQHKGSPYQERPGRRGPWFVAPVGSEHSYTNRLQDAKRYPTQAAAEGARCVESEIIRRYEDAGR